VAQVQVRIHRIEHSRADQAVDVGRTLATGIRTGEQVVAPS